MKFPIPRLTLAVMAATATASMLASAEQAVTLQTLEVDAQAEKTAPYATPVTSSSTGLNLSVRETPQTVTSVEREQLDDYSLTSINDVLQASPGISVEQVETDRTYYSARGFEITNFQLDGLGLPSVFSSIQGDPDTFLYERVEVIRGANGLMSGSGEPSATINLVRKRPTAETQAQASVMAGSWNTKRFEGDVSGSLNDTGSVRGRFVTALESGDSYLDRYEKDRQLFYGVVEADLGDKTLLTLGYSEYTDRPNSPLWGALPMQYSDGSPTNYSASASTSQEWAYWDSETRNAFIELEHDFVSGWKAQARLSSVTADAKGKMFYASGAPDPVDGSGMYGTASRFDEESEQLIGDLRLSGDFALAGRTHDVVLGTQWYQADLFQSSYNTGDAANESDILAGKVPEPTITASDYLGGADWRHRQTDVYSSVRWSLSDTTHLITGGRMTSLERNGEGYYGASENTKYNNELVPYVGLVQDLNTQTSLYVSYTEIFDPQTETDIAGQLLDPKTGNSYELGLKHELNGGALVTASVFRAQQDDVAVAAGTSPITGQSYHTAEDGVSSQGFELGLSGELLPNFYTSAGYAYVDIEAADGSRTKTEVPRHSLNLTGTYHVPEVSGLKLGAQARWQDEVSSSAAKQGDYAVFDLLAGYQLTPELEASVLVKNVTDEKYLNSVKWAQAYYGAPRSAQVKLTWKY